MPVLRPFRALRYALPDGADLSRLVCPPYDVITPEGRAGLAARDARNAVHLELPEGTTGAHGGLQTGHESGYQAAARLLVRWRNERVLRKDTAPSIYATEMRFTVPGTSERRTLRGFQARLALEPLGAGVLRHERTLSGPKEDRLQLLRATGANLSPVMLLAQGWGESRDRLERMCAGEPTACAREDDGTEHRVWRIDGDAEGGGADALAVLDEAGSRPLVIADGHHRYETALRYREERGQRRACESDPPYDYVLALFFDIRDPALTVLPTHRLLPTGPGREALLESLARAFRLESTAGPAALVERFGPLGDPSLDPATIGLVLHDWCGLLHRRSDTSELPGHEATGWGGGLAQVGAAVLGDAMQTLLGLGPDAVSRGGLRYTKDALEAAGAVQAGQAAAAFLLQPTPAEAVAAVASAGAVMPQKSTFFYPKAATGLLFNVLES